MTTARRLTQVIVSDAWSNGLAAAIARGEALMPTAMPHELVRLLLTTHLLPELAQGIEELIVSVDLPAVRGFGGGLLSYIYSPFDIIPDDDTAAGLVDDVLVCALGFALLVKLSALKMDSSLRAIVDEVEAAAGAALSAEHQALVRSFVNDLQRSTNLHVELGSDR